MPTRERSTHKKSTPLPYPIGSNVHVRGGVKNPDRGHSIGGWQGRVTAWDGATIEIAWDSLTLQVMPARLIEWCEVEGFDWSVMWLGPDDVAPSEPREQPGDTARAKKALGRNIAWAFLGPEGRRKQNVLDGIGSLDDRGAFKAGQTFLQRRHTFPCIAVLDDGPGY